MEKLKWRKRDEANNRSILVLQIYKREKNKIIKSTRKKYKELLAGFDLLNLIKFD